MHLAVCGGFPDMINLLMKTPAKEDLKTKNRVGLTPIEYSVTNSPERALLLQLDPSLQQFLQQEEESKDDDSKTED